jgi:hypothetical protein
MKRRICGALISCLTVCAACLPAKGADLSPLPDWARADPRKRQVVPKRAVRTAQDGTQQLEPIVVEGQRAPDGPKQPDRVDALRKKLDAPVYVETTDPAGNRRICGPQGCRCIDNPRGNVNVHIEGPVPPMSIARFC